MAAGKGLNDTKSSVSLRLFPWCSEGYNDFFKQYQLNNECMRCGSDGCPWGHNFQFEMFLLFVYVFCGKVMFSVTFVCSRGGVAVPVHYGFIGRLQSHAWIMGQGFLQYHYIM